MGIGTIIKYLLVVIGFNKVAYLYCIKKKFKQNKFKEDKFNTLGSVSESEWKTEDQSTHLIPPIQAQSLSSKLSHTSIPPTPLPASVSLRLLHL